MFPVLTSIKSEKKSPKLLKTYSRLPVLASSQKDALDAYCQEVNRYAYLTAEEEHRYAVEYHQTESKQAAWHLVTSHLRYVVSLSRQYIGYGLSQADLIQEGNLGLMKAVKKFDPFKGVRLVTFAMYWIKAEMTSYILKNWRLVKIASSKEERKLFFNLRSELAGQKLTPKEQKRIAKKLNVSEKDVENMYVRMMQPEIGFDREQHSDSDDTTLAPIDYLQSETMEPSEQLIDLEKQDAVNSGLPLAINQLDERSKHIVTSRWLTETPKTLHELASELKVSAERIRQIEQVALKKMRQFLQTQPQWQHGSI
jgi:RNA polymerase sigma-32 factor